MVWLALQAGAAAVMQLQKHCLLRCTLTALTTSKLVCGEQDAVDDMPEAAFVKLLD